ncbi:MAG: xanthine dehydrogenase accessory protein XdhC [Rhodobacteraceae bacterium]|nr:xanthine dehydrogenase accessory protein XdhC [Paracoccaceae bacterium]
MSLDREALARDIAAAGQVVRVVLAGHEGSAPREAGAAMHVWAGGQSGTIGGGALEWEAAARARAMLAAGRDAEVIRLALGPALGQCCGGAVTLVAERWDAGRLAGLRGEVVARPLPGAPEAMPLPVARLLARARDRGERPATRIVAGWLVEPVARPARMVWVWGAGHVGRAIVAVLAPLPDLKVTWIDTDPARFPAGIPAGVEQRIAPDPAALAAAAPAGAEHLVLTFSHALDLAICHALLSRDFASLGLIGSATKRARFRSRLAALGHEPERIARIVCPIGMPALGKHPQAIAVGVAAALLAGQAVAVASGDEGAEERAS